jgi:hypothetical protein
MTRWLCSASSLVGLSTRTCTSDGTDRPLLDRGRPLEAVRVHAPEQVRLQSHVVEGRAGTEGIVVVIAAAAVVVVAPSAGVHILPLQ